MCRTASPAVKKIRACDRFRCSVFRARRASASSRASMTSSNVWMPSWKTVSNPAQPLVPAFAFDATTSEHYVQRRLRGVAAESVLHLGAAAFDAQAGDRQPERRWHDAAHGIAALVERDGAADDVAPAAKAPPQGARDDGAAVVGEPLAEER
jgi:hypothetical protein